MSGIVTLIIDEHHISLGENADLQVLSNAIVSAVRDGGDFVHVESAHGQRYDVLVTARTRAVFLRSEGGLDTSADDGWTQSLDLDF